MTGFEYLRQAAEGLLPGRRIEMFVRPDGIEVRAVRLWFCHRRIVSWEELEASRINPLVMTADALEREAEDDTHIWKARGLGAPVR